MILWTSATVTLTICRPYHQTNRDLCLPKQLKIFTSVTSFQAYHEDVQTTFKIS